jgi:hypothetical protein
MNAVLLPQISTQALTPEESAEQNDDSSDTSSNTSSDSHELQTLTDDSDDEAISNIQRINLIFSGLEDPNYDTPEEDLLDR